MQLQDKNSTNDSLILCLPTQTVHINNLSISDAVYLSHDDCSG